MILFLTYAVFLFLILRFCMVLFNYLSNPRLPAAPRNYYDFISILIPSYVDLTQLAGLLQSIREQDFENYEVIVGGDGSKELEQVFELATGRDDRFMIAAAPGDTEKLCGHLASRAKGDYFLFLNHVERIETGLLYNSLYRMKLHSLGLLSLFADQKMKRFGEGQLVPLANLLLTNLLPLRLILLTRWKWLAAANGQFLLFNAVHYRTFQWHLGGQSSAPGEAELPDGTRIMKKVKELGFRVESLFANRYVTGRMYAGRNGFVAFREDLISGSGGNFLLLFLYLLLCCIGFMYLLPVLSMQLLGMALTLVVGMRIMVSLMGNQPVWWNLLFHPLQMAVLTVAICASLFRIVRKIR